MLQRIAIAGISAVLLAACGGATVPLTAASAAATGRLINPRMPLLYVGDLGKAQVDVLTYPQGKPRFTLTGFGSVNGLCADVDGDVYVSDGHNGKLREYPYNVRKPTRTLSDPGYYTQGCAIDPKTGDLAVAIQPMSSNPGGVAIFRHATGKPQNYVGYDFFFPGFCTYDYSRNLFFDGTDIHGMFFFAELARRSKTMQRISLPQSIQVAGGLQFDGQNVAVDDQGAGYRGSTIYEFSISGTRATETGTTPLDGSLDVIGFSLYDNRVIGPNSGSAPNVMYWRYPKGGKSLKTLTGFTEPVAVVVSELPSR
jgi:hypothetical protein